MRDGTIYIVDDDVVLTSTLASLFTSVKINTEIHLSPEPFLALPALARPGCILLDVRLPGINGLEVLERTRQRGWTIPVLMMSGYADVTMAVQAMHKGATDFLEKPVNAAVLLQRVQHCIEQDMVANRSEQACQTVRELLMTLTDRERGVLNCIQDGMPNKVTATKLNLSVKAIEGHRVNLLKKMRCTSAIDLVKMVSICPKNSGNPALCAGGANPCRT